MCFATCSSASPYEATDNNSSQFYAVYLEGPKAGFSCLRARGPARGQEFQARERELSLPRREFLPLGLEFLSPGGAPGPEAGKPGLRAL